MCQSKSQGGRRCAGKGKGSSFFPPSLEVGLSENQYVCPKCGTVNQRGTMHSCFNKNLITLSPAQNNVHHILKDAGVNPFLAGEDVRNALASQAEGKNLNEAKSLHVNGDLAEAAKALKEAGVEATHHDNVLTVTDKEGNAVTVTNDDGNSPYSIDQLKYNPETGVVEDSHGGLADIRDGVIRHTEPFEDNPASVLRGAVLAAQTGYSVAPDTLSEAAKVADLYESIPKEQVWKQWEDLSLSKTPSKALNAIYEMGWEKNFPELANIRGVPQSDFWHPEGPVEVHTGQAADIAARKAEEEGLNAEDRSVVVIAAISHDLGKAESTVIDEDGKISSAGHEYTGTKLSRKFLRGIGASPAVKRQVPLIVYAHMHHAQAPSERAVRRLMTKLDNDGKGTTIELWARVAEADKAGRGSAGTFGVREEFLAVAETVRMKDAKKKRNFINGDLLKGLGYKPGENFRDMIVATQAAYESNEIKDEAEAGAWIKKNFPL